MTISVVPSPRESRRLTGTVEPPRRMAPREDTPPREWPVWALKLRQEYEARIAQLEREKSSLEAAMVAARRAQREMNDTALTLYGGSTALQEVTKQVSISPKFASLNAQEHEYVGRIALATGLNPEFHIHAWTAEVYDREVKAKVRKLFVMPDYKALIQLSKRDYLMLKERRLTADEMRERGIPERDIEEGSIAYVVEGYELDKAALAKQAGIEYEPLRGFGWWAAKKDDVAWNGAERKMLPTGKRIDNDVPQGRDGAWVAWKRAIRALYNQLADLTLKFNQPVGVATADEDTWVFETADTPMVIDAEASVRKEAAPASTDSNGNGWEPAACTEPFSAGTWERLQKWLVSQGVASNGPHAAGLLRKSLHAAGLIENREASWPAIYGLAISTADAWSLIMGREKGKGEAVEAAIPDGEPVGETPGESEPISDDEPTGQPVRMCKNCGVEEAVETPLGSDYCDTCASRIADAQAAKSK